MFLIIGVWGGKRRVYAAFKFFLYTLLGSVLDVAGDHRLPTAGIDGPADGHGEARPAVHLAVLAVAGLLRLLFSVKVPMWPVHTWPSDAHVEAPTSSSQVGVLLKMQRLRLPALLDPVGLLDRMSNLHRWSSARRSWP